MQIGERQPYVGELVFTAFSGSHQDAINKGDAVHGKVPQRQVGGSLSRPSTRQTWARDDEPIIRINSQSGKGGTAFIMARNFGFELPKAMHPEFSDIVQAETDTDWPRAEARGPFWSCSSGNISRSTTLIASSTGTSKRLTRTSTSAVSFSGTLCCEGKRTIPISGQGNLHLRALSTTPSTGRTWIVTPLWTTRNTPSTPALRLPGCGHTSTSGFPTAPMSFGVGMDHNISMASIKGVLSAINRAKKLEAKKGA